MSAITEERASDKPSKTRTAGQQFRHEESARFFKTLPVRDYVKSGWRITLVGEGGESKVYSVRRGKEHHIVKIFQRSIRAGSVLAGFNANKAAAALLPDRVVVYDSIFKTPDGLVGMALSYVEGISIEKLIEEHKKRGDLIPLDVAYEIIVQLFDILATLNDNGIFHRDIKPGNVMWNPKTKKVTLIDFDISCLSGTGRGTCDRYYASATSTSPDMARVIVSKEKTSDAEVIRRDVARCETWAACVTAFCILNSATPVSYTHLRAHETM
jgi:serine/threonine protein kinase